MKKQHPVFPRAPQSFLQSSKVLPSSLVRGNLFLGPEHIFLLAHSFYSITSTGGTTIGGGGETTIGSTGGTIPVLGALALLVAALAALATSQLEGR
jgi:hypothetical protein